MNTAWTNPTTALTPQQAAAKEVYSQASQERQSTIAPLQTLVTAEANDAAARERSARNREAIINDLRQQQEKSDIHLERFQTCFSEPANAKSASSFNYGYKMNNDIASDPDPYTSSLSGSSPLRAGIAVSVPASLPPKMPQNHNAYSETLNLGSNLFPAMGDTTGSYNSTYAGISQKGDNADVQFPRTNKMGNVQVPHASRDHVDYVSKNHDKDTNLSQSNPTDDSQKPRVSTDVAAPKFKKGDDIIYTYDGGNKRKGKIDRVVVEQSPHGLSWTYSIMFDDGVTNKECLDESRLSYDEDIDDDL